MTLPAPPPPAALNPQVGCGADELIDLLMRCVLEPGDAIVDSPPTFTMYCFDADVNDARVITVPRLEGFRVDVEAIKWVMGRRKGVGEGRVWVRGVWIINVPKVSGRGGHQVGGEWGQFGVGKGRVWVRKVWSGSCGSSRCRCLRASKYVWRQSIRCMGTDGGGVEMGVGWGGAAEGRVGHHRA